MSQCYPKNWELCGTCAYWTGEREADMFGNYAYVDSPMARGICRNSDCGWFRQSRQANVSCPDYEKWSILSD